MPTITETLIASLTAVGSPACWAPGADDDERYMDWSSRTPDGGYLFEAGDGSETAQFKMTRDELIALHAAITLTLLRDQEA